MLDREFERRMEEHLERYSSPAKRDILRNLDLARQRKEALREAEASDADIQRLLVALRPAMGAYPR